MKLTDQQIRDKANAESKQWYNDLLNDGTDDSTYLPEAYDCGYTNGYTACQSEQVDPVEFQEWTFKNHWVYEGHFKLWRFEMANGLFDVSRDISTSDLLEIFRKEKGL